jgi:2,4-diketo-3-deoxy-L-fuconate hydrolase
VKLASFYYDGADRIGVLKNDDELALIDYAGGMTDLIRLGNDGNEHLEHALNDGDIARCSEVRWYPPVRRPGKICGVAMNNSASNARKISAPDHPAFFLKPSSSLVGHNEAVKIRTYYGSVHPEPELAIVIGKATRDVDAADALGQVYGYSIFNDITGNGMRAEDMFHYWALYSDDNNPDELQRREQHLSYAARYKGTDTFACMGPFITTTDEIGNPDDLDVHCEVGGETIAEDSTRYYNYKVAELISYISQFQTLDPGDVVSCGTAFKPSKDRKSIHHANFQRVAGPVEISISGLGTLSNPVQIEDKSMGQWRLS